MSGRIERVGIYGGTFSPIHMGHVRAALAYMEQEQPDRLLVIPTATPPHKAEVAGADEMQRLHMVKLAFAGCDAYRRGQLEVSDCEIRRTGKSYTVLTLEELSAPDRELSLLVGTDMFLTLDQWFRAEDIFRLARIVLMRRENESANDAAIAGKWTNYEQHYGARLARIHLPPLVVSSTELRQRLKDGGTTEGLLPDGVAAYIAENNLYK